MLALTTLALAPAALFCGKVKPCGGGGGGGGGSNHNRGLANAARNGNVREIVRIVRETPRELLDLDCALNHAASRNQLHAMSTLVEFGAIGVGGAAMMGLVWGMLQSYSPRENLAMTDAAAGLSSATEDELLLGMKPLWRVTSLAARCICVGLETAADVILIFAFLPAVVEGVETPTGGARQSLLAAAAASLTYGSQHLRFRNEWLVCMAFGAVLQGVTTALVGRRLLGLLVAVELFAIGRDLRGVGLVDRKFSAQ